MPLQAQEKSVRGVFDRLDNSIGGRRAGNEGTPDRFHRLVMRTVHLHARAFDDSIEETAGCDRDAVGHPSRRGALPVLQGVTHLCGNILIETPSTGDVHGLHAPADGEGGDAVAHERLTDEIQFKVGSPLGHNLEAVSLAFPIQGRVQVWSASGQE